MKNFPEIFTLKAVADIATELGFNTPYVVRTEEEEAKYFETFTIESLEKEFPHGTAKLEVVTYNGKKIAAIAYMGTKETIVPGAQIESAYSQMK